MTNGSGIFKILKLRKGQYAFAKGDVSLEVAQAWTDGAELSAFPNPATHQVAIEMQPGDDRVHIYRYSGEKVLQCSPRTTALGIDVSEWAAGAYLVVIEGSTGRRTGQFLVER